MIVSIKLCAIAIDVAEDRRALLREKDFASSRELLYPGHCVCGVLSSPDPPKMLARNSPTGHFQFRPATILGFDFSAKEIDAAAPIESLQNVPDSPSYRDFQQAAVLDFIIVK
jgi:hypothetical protein